MPSAVIVLLVVAAIAWSAFWGWAIADVFQRADWEFPSRQPGSNDRVLWTFVVLLGNTPGALAYYVLVMKPYPRQRR
jgi:hypothetical protein